MVQWASEEINRPALTGFTQEVFNMLSSCITNEPTIEREKMWATYYEIRCSSAFRKQWSEFLQESVKVIVEPVFYQHVTDDFFRSPIEKKFVTSRSVQADFAPTELTYEESNALRWICVAQDTYKANLCSPHIPQRRKWCYV